MADNTGIRPHFHVSTNLLHGAVKDVGVAHGINRAEAYEVSTMLLVALEDTVPFTPRSDREDVQAALDALLNGCGGGGVYSPTALMPTNGDTRPHFHVSNLLHGAMKDIAELHDIGRADVYVVAALLLVALEPDVPLSPGSEDEAVQAVLENYLAECFDEVRSPETPD